MRYILIMAITLCMFEGTSQNQVADSTKMDEIVISAHKYEEKRQRVAQQVQVINEKYIKSLSALNAADLLQSTGDIFVQKSQQGGGSPVIRGFEASRVLLVVDGVRLNNLIYRAGHLQNVITLDPNMTERVEILNGPASNVYGSDALGGVIHFKTKDPKFGTSDKLKSFGSALSSYHSANKGTNFNISYNIGWQKFASFTSVTLTRLGDLRMGGAKNPFYSNGYFGERPYYVERINGKDELIQNPDKLVQKFSGYDQIDILQKFVYKSGEKSEHSLNIQYSNSTNIPRYDRLTDPKGTGLNSAEWYYGPQKRIFGLYKYNRLLEGFFNRFEVALNYQNVQESRHNRGFGSANLNNRIEDVQVADVQINLNGGTEVHKLRTGVEAYWNTVKSTANRENITTGSLSPLDTRYPGGDNNVYNVSVYGAHTYKISDKFTLNDGLRVGYNGLSSIFIDKTFFPFPFDKVVQNNLVYSGSGGLIYSHKGLRASVLTSLGYRTPNIDDLSKVFESTPGSLIIPNPNIKPEKSWTNELSLGYFNKTWSIENVSYYTTLTDFIAITPSTFDGNSTITYNGTLSNVFTSVNIGKGFIYGNSLNIKAVIKEIWSFYGTLGYTYGRSSQDTGEKPLDHIPPVFGKFGVDANYSKWFFSLNTIFNGKKDIRDFSTSGEDNPQYAPATGMPAWMIFNFRTSYMLFSNLKLQAGVDNITDIQYRYFASGINAPGRNIFAAVRINF